MTEFALIMGIGTVFAILVVANLPKSGAIPYDEDENPFLHKEPPQTPRARNDVAETWSLGDLDYWHKLERHQRDPQHWPCPIPPDAPPKIESD
jgi:hypothetical protein